MKSLSKSLKGITVVFVVVMMVLTVLLCTACKEKGLDIVVYDYKTQDKITTINSVDSFKRFEKVMTLLEPEGEDSVENIEEEVAYSVLYKDPKDSTYDIWLKVAVDSDKAYVKYDYEKMDEEYGETFKDMSMPQEYLEVTNMTPEELKAILTQ
ncbi:MAG: hypothetical protein IKB73_05925 [Ruminococcus sp.]|nr:hypothetical protein [Ruminococcus sp.]